MSTPDFQDASRPIQIAAPVVEKEFQMRLVDWQRIHREVSDIPQHSSFYLNLGFASGGISVSALLAYLGFIYTQNCPLGIQYCSFSVFIVSAIVSGLAFCMARDKDLQMKSSVKLVQEDMTSIHQRCFPDKKMNED